MMSLIYINCCQHFDLEGALVLIRIYQKFHRSEFFPVKSTTMSIGIRGGRGTRDFKI